MINDCGAHVDAGGERALHAQVYFRVSEQGLGILKETFLKDPAAVHTLIFLKMALISNCVGFRRRRRVPNGHIGDLNIKGKEEMGVFSGPISPV